MLSFIRKRLPSRDRSDEHLQRVHQNDDSVKRSQSTNELNVKNNDDNKKQTTTKKKKNKKTKSSLALHQDVQASHSSPTNDRINKSYSSVDYFPMMSQPVNHDIKATNRDSLSDCYLNPMESVQTTVRKPRVFQIPVIDCRQEQRIPNYKDIDHQRTKALQDVTDQQIQKRSVK